MALLRTNDLPVSPLPCRVFALALVVLPAEAAAQEPQAATAPDIVVLGRGLPLPPGTPAYGSVVIDHQRLVDNASGRTEDVLADVAGFQQFRRSDSRSANPSAQGVTLRALGGNASSRALVLLDGIPQADPFFGYIPFNAILPDRLSAVRVTRGGGSGAFGAGAVAGTIELVSADRGDLPPVTVDAAYGSRDAVTASASVTPSVGRGFVSVSGSYERGDGFFTTPPPERVAASVPARYRDWSLALRAVTPLGGNTELQARGLLYRDDRTLRFAGADSGSQAQDASIRLVHRGNWAMDALACIQLRNFTNKVVSATRYRLVLDQRDTPSTGIGGKIELRPPVGPGHVLRIGADARLAQGRLAEEPHSAVTGLVTSRRTAGGSTLTVGAFAEDDWTVGKLVLTGGVRIDRWSITDGYFREAGAAGMTLADQRFADRHGTEATGRAGALFHAGDTLLLRAAGYTGFRLPTLNELYRPFTVFPITTEANGALGVERLRGVEAGVDLTPAAGIKIGVTGFYNRLAGAIANVTLTPVLRRRENVDAITAWGVEATATARRGDFSLHASYAYADSRVRGSGPSAALDGLRPAQSPQHSASATFAWRPRRGAALSTTLRYVGRQYEDDLQADILPPALTVDAVAQFPVAEHVSIVGRAENIFDETVVTRNSGGTIDLGTPRTLWIGVRIGD